MPATSSVTRGPSQTGERTHAAAIGGPRTTPKASTIHMAPPNDVLKRKCRADGLSSPARHRFLAGDAKISPARPCFNSDITT